MAERALPRRATALTLLELIFHATIRDVRKDHRNAIVGILLNMAQTVVLVLAFYLLLSVFNLRTVAVRGDFLLYIMSGIFLFLTHTKALGAVVKAEGPASPMMQHAPMNTIVAIAAAALGSLYIQVLSLFAVLTIYHSAVTPVEIHQPVYAFLMFLLAWASGVAVGIVFLALKPWFPNFVRIGSTVYARANMIASGKMFLANTMPGYLIVWFDWNPLFHAIDQSRGFAFLNYNPFFTSISYPLIVTAVLVLLGMMGEFYTRRHASLSWGAGR